MGVGKLSILKLNKSINVSCSGHVTTWLECWSSSYFLDHVTILTNSISCDRRALALKMYNLLHHCKGIFTRVFARALCGVHVHGALIPFKSWLHRDMSTNRRDPNQTNITDKHDRQTNLQTYRYADSINRLLERYV